MMFGSGQSCLRSGWSINSDLNFNKGEQKMDRLPDEIILDLMLLLPLKDVCNLSMTEKRYLAVTENDYFWKRKFERDHGASKSWKETYKNRGRIYTAGREYGMNNYREKHDTTRPISMAAHSDSMLFSDCHGQVWQWGRSILNSKEYENSFRNLALPVKVRKVSVGLDHAMFLTEEDEAWGVGRKMVHVQLDQTQHAAQGAKEDT